MEQPKALRLADHLEQWNYTVCGEQVNNAAAELRRLHEVNTELLEALQAVMTEHEDGYGLKCVQQVKAAIAKATGEQA